jgi:hypothetical protein
MCGRGSLSRAFGAGLIAPTGAFELRQFDRMRAPFRCAVERRLSHSRRPVLPSELNEKM